MQDRFIHEPAVLSNERLYQQVGGEPIVWAVIDMNDESVVSVWLNESSARQNARGLNIHLRFTS